VRTAPHEARARRAGARGHRRALRPAAGLAALLAGAALLLLPHLGAAPIERAEIYFLDAARGMVESGDWVVPRYRGAPFYDKPALAYWLMAVAFAWEGATPAAARLVPVGAALSLLLATYALGARLLGRAAALRGALVLATTLLFLAFARVAMSDMLLALWCTAAAALAAHASGRRGSAALAGAGLALGLGFLTKGPVALLFGGIGAALVVWDARRRGERLPGWPAFVAAGLLAAVVAVPWFVALYGRMGAEPLRWFFLRENLQRFAGETYDSGRSGLYYFGAYAALGLPWSVLFPRAAFTLPRERRVLLWWLAVMLVPLSLSRGKIDYYLLPLAPAASLVIGWWLAAREWTNVDRAFARVAAGLAAAGALALLAGTLRIPPAWRPGPAGEAALLVVAAVAAASALLVAWRPGPTRLTAVLGGGAALLYAALVNAHLPAFRAAQPNAAIVADVVRERTYRSDAVLAFCRDAARAHRDVLFDARHPAEERCDLWALATSDLPRLLLLTPDERASLAAVPALRDVAEYDALPATALTLRGLVAGVSPERVILAANYATNDPVAEWKRKKDRKRALSSRQE
jgi:4-amino-4-deoxy-L-arabinose transferase-like glycosyltransferase